MLSLSAPTNVEISAKHMLSRWGPYRCEDVAWGEIAGPNHSVMKARSSAVLRGGSVGYCRKDRNRRMVSSARP